MQEFQKIDTYQNVLPDLLLMVMIGSVMYRNELKVGYTNAWEYLVQRISRWI